MQWRRLHIWRRRWHPTPVLLPGKSHGWRSLVGCSSRGRKMSDSTERLHFQFSLSCTGEGNGNPLQCSCLENPREGEPGGLPSMGSHRVGQDWSDLAAAADGSQMLHWVKNNQSQRLHGVWLHLLDYYDCIHSVIYLFNSLNRIKYKDERRSVVTWIVKNCRPQEGVPRGFL